MKITNLYNNFHKNMYPTDYIEGIQEFFKVNSVLALLGPGQCGKTALAKSYIEQQKSFPEINYFDLERRSDTARLANPELALAAPSGA